MKITFDNFDGRGGVDYTGALDTAVPARVDRRLNAPSKFNCTLMGVAAGFVVPAVGARIVVSKRDGGFFFTGYTTEAARSEYLGWGEQGSVYRYGITAESDEILLDQKSLPNRAPFVARSAGSALRQLAADLLPGAFDLSSVQELDPIAAYTVNPQKTFSQHAGEIALLARASYRAMNGALTLSPVGENSYSLDESDPSFSAAGLELQSPNKFANDVTVIGLEEPQAYVRDYFVGDGKSTHFYLSQAPFQQSRRALIDEQFLELDPSKWTVKDPASVFSVLSQALKVSGGTGQDGGTSLSFVEQIELGGALELQHGDLSFSAASRGIVGGLYSGTVSVANCLAGFQVTPSGTQSKIQALISGVATGPTVTTTAGHRYLFTTYIYCTEVYRSSEAYHSSAHPCGRPLGGSAVAGDVRIVLEVQDVDLGNPATMVAPATVLYDNVISNAPGFCTYVLVNAASMQCSIASTYVTHIATAEVRTALPGQSYETRLVESLADGGECLLVNSTTLDFYPQYVPPVNTLIVASYRGYGRAVAEVADSQSIATLASGTDDGVRGLVRTMKAPAARTQSDCENAALALLEDARAAAWSGTYRTWSDFLPGAASDIFPGDGLAVNVASQNAAFRAIVRRVEIEMADPTNDRGMYTIEFANDLALPLAMETEATGTIVPLQDVPVRQSSTQVGSCYLASLTGAQITQVSSATVQVDVGMNAPNGCGCEVRAHDFGWGAGNDRTLLGRFGGRTFTLPRYAQTQTYFIRMYDNSSPPRYSRYAAALHVDYPL